MTKFLVLMALLFSTSAFAGVVVSAAPAIVTMNAAAAAARNRSHIAECEALLDNFVAKDATVKAAREYADCVNFIHPQETGHALTPPEKVFVSILLLSAVIGFIGGAMSEGILFGLGCMVFAPIVITFLSFFGLLAYAGFLAVVA